MLFCFFSESPANESGCVEQSGTNSAAVNVRARTALTHGQPFLPLVMQSTILKEELDDIRLAVLNGYDQRRATFRRDQSQSTAIGMGLVPVTLRITERRRHPRRCPGY